MAKQRSGGVTLEAGPEEHDPALDDLPVINQGVETQKDFDSDRAVVQTKPVLRPSKAAELAKKAGFVNELGAIDVHRWLKSEGYPAPKRLIRVVPAVAAMAAKWPALEFEAFDESDACRQFFDHYKIKNGSRHVATLHATILEE